MGKGGVDSDIHENNKGIIKKLYPSRDIPIPTHPIKINPADGGNIQDTEEVLEESLSLVEKEVELIIKALGQT